MERLRRYFVGNTCPIFSIKLTPWYRGKYIPANGGNFGGFYWRGLHVMWRKPYADCWVYRPEVKQWVIRSLVEPAQ